MKRIVSAVAVALIILLGYLFWDFDFAANEDFEVRNLGDAREIFLPSHPRSSIPPDVIFFAREANNLIAISSDLSLQKGSDLQGREETCIIFVTNLDNGERAQFESKEVFAKRYAGSDRIISQVLREYDRQQC